MRLDLKEEHALHKNLSPSRSSKGHSESQSLDLGTVSDTYAGHLLYCLVLAGKMHGSESNGEVWRINGTVHEACSFQPEISANHKVGRCWLCLEDHQSQDHKPR